MIFEVIRIGSPIKNKTQFLGASIFSGETGLVWHMVILKERFSDRLVKRLSAIRYIPELGNLIQEINKSGYEFVLSRESIPCYGDEEELINFIADEILVNWQEESTALSPDNHHYPEILVFSNKPENVPVVRKITADTVDGQEVLCITVSLQNP